MKHFAAILLTLFLAAPLRAQEGADYRGLFWGQVAKTCMVPVKWEGVYGHVQRDFSHERWRSGLGYGLGYLFLGLEAGLAVHVDDRDTHLGAEAAVVGTLGFVGIHVRHTRFFEQPAVTEIEFRPAAK